MNRFDVRNWLRTASPDEIAWVEDCITDECTKERRTEMIEWDTLVLEARRKAREVNPRACILTDVDVVLAMADEIDRLRATNAKLTEAIVHVLAAWEDGIDRDDIILLRLALAAAETGAATSMSPA